MSHSTLQPVWSPEDYREVFERAATARLSAGCPHALVQHRQRYQCEIVVPHDVHTNFTLGARWAVGGAR